MPFIPNTDEDRRKMLERIGVADFASLLQDIPEELRLKSRLDLSEPLSEMEVRRAADSLSRKNVSQENAVSFMGAGVYDHYIPSVIDKIVSRAEYYTAYTPYQPEVSQGTLQVIYEYQSMICELTGMEVSNASMYDGASALAEAALMGRSINGREEIVLASTIHPRYRSAVKTYLHHLCCLIEIPHESGVSDLDYMSDKVGDNTCAIVVQQPNFFGCLEDVFEMAKMAHDAGAVLISCVDPVSLGVIAPPGDYGADITVGEGQPLGLPSSFGGPFLGIFASKSEHVRKMPGRLVGRTTDLDGQEGFVLTLQTREQHIRREKATSNICTNEALCALSSCVYLALMGKQGLCDAAKLCMEKSHYLAGRISELDGFQLPFSAPFFKEFAVKCPIRPEKFIASLVEKGFIPGVPLGRFDSSLSDMLLLAVTEKRTKQEMDSLVSLLRDGPD
ncbi:aminomethyl-transferring glycine dehydrogenase subunit GcvPA [candidate division TA06 bacterium]|uniref:Probable glycine dehydrogenase (decarboxylating) subunit 1 n=1 Tax=candidate division TA06 bacterium TaxID=2250710 RepID=A0A523XPV8_UNCT6|nr:MAG: aminomethyl-transferring glycine dehydrogenase subunit GcvPA [candidate division TA06 bacterium]